MNVVLPQNKAREIQHHQQIFALTHSMFYIKDFAAELHSNPFPLILPKQIFLLYAYFFTVCLSKRTKEIIKDNTTLQS